MKISGSAVYSSAPGSVPGMVSRSLHPVLSDVPQNGQARKSDCIARPHDEHVAVITVSGGGGSISDVVVTLVTVCIGWISWTGWLAALSFPCAVCPASTSPNIIARPRRMTMPMASLPWSVCEDASPEK